MFQTSIKLCTKSHIFKLVYIPYTLTCMCLWMLKTLFWNSKTGCFGLTWFHSLLMKIFNVLAYYYSLVLTSRTAAAVIELAAAVAALIDFLCQSVTLWTQCKHRSSARTTIRGWICCCPDMSGQDPAHAVKMWLFVLWFYNAYIRTSQLSHLCNKTKCEI